MDEFLTDAAEINQIGKFWGFNPKLGAIYEINRQTQAFANVSRSWQPPSMDNLVDFMKVRIPASFTRRRSRNMPGHHRSRNWRRVFAVEWELSLYRSWVRSELLEINDAGMILGQKRYRAQITRN
jgi:iron complex outermembrane receptor protein